MTTPTLDTDAIRDDVDVSRDDAGSTLIEVLIGIALMGTIVAAMLTSLVASSTAFDVAELETVLINASDTVHRATPDCDYGAVVDAVGIAEGWPSGSITSVEELLVRDPDGTNPQFVAACTVVQPGDVQSVVITATHPSSGVVQSLKVVKSSVP